MRPAFLIALAAAAVAPTLGGARAQSGTGTMVIQPENVRWDVAQVMRVDPIYQTLRARRMEQQCGESVPATGSDKGLSRIVGAVRGALTRKQEQERVTLPRSTCRMVPVEREFRRPIAYDVDYVFKGMKYRSRLPYDPGNRLRVRVSVMPYVPQPGER